MFYLDEQIQLIVNFSTITITESGLYRYDLIDDVADEPLFIGNCYIEKGATSRTIDITDLCRSIIQWKDNTEFQQGFIVRIWNKEQTEFNTSQQVTVLPIYRYPNRKSRLETPLQETEQDWYIPSLQGYNSDKEAELLPHTPFVSTEEVSYDLLVNYGTLQRSTKDALKLFTGVEKDLNINNNSLTHTSYTLKDLFSDSKEVETIAWDYGGSIDGWEVVTIPNDTSVNVYNRIAPLIYEFKLYRMPNWYTYSTDYGEHWSVNKIAGFPLNATYSGNINEGEYLDTFICVNEPEDTPDDYYINFYPNVIKDCKVTVQLGIEYEPNNYIDLITNTTAGEISSTYILERDTVGGDTFKIEIGKTGAAGDKPDKTFENLTIGDTIEFDDTSDSQWLKLYDSTGTLIDTLTFNADVMEEGSWKEYAIRLEEMDTYLALFPLQQVYTVKAELRNYITPQPIEVNDISIRRRIPSSGYYGTYYNYTGEILYGNGSVNGSIVINKPIYGGQVTPMNEQIYIITRTGEVIYLDKQSNDTYTVDYLDVEGIYVAYPFTSYNGSVIKQQAFFVVKYPWEKEDELIRRFQLRISSTGDSILQSSSNYFKVWNKANIYNYTKVASIDYCPSRYYLQWRDRFGSMQMQPFNKIDTYSEKFVPAETKDYRNNRKIANVSVQPKWKLNTGWLNDKVYPYYESIFVSPYLTLYDTTEDKSYSVIVTNTDYTEKTFTNQSKQLFNLQLDVELNNTQNILY